MKKMHMIIVCIHGMGIKKQNLRKLLGLFFSSQNQGL